VYQLQAERTQAASDHIRGRYLFNPKATYSGITRLFRDNGALEKVSLTKRFDYQSFQRERGEGLLPLFFALPSKELSVITVDKQIIPKAGQVIIGLTQKWNN